MHTHMHTVSLSQASLSMLRPQDLPHGGVGIPPKKNLSLALEAELEALSARDRSAIHEDHFRLRDSIMVPLIQSLHGLGPEALNP